MRRLGIRVNPDLVILDMRRPDLYGLGAGGIAGLAGPDEKPALMKRAFDLLADDRAFAERARPVRAFIPADEVFVAELIDGIGLVIDDGARGEFAAHFVGAADEEFSHGSGKLKASRPLFNTRRKLRPGASIGDGNTAVDDNGLTGDVAARLRGEEHGDAVNVLRLAQASQRRRGDAAARAFRIVPEGACEIGLDEA